MRIRRHDAEGEAPEDSGESFSGEDDESVRRSMPLCGDGFGNIAIRYLLDIQTLGVVLSQELPPGRSPREHVEVVTNPGAIYRTLQ